MAERRSLVAGRYRLVEPVGAGGMGRVWRARDEMLDRDVAVKEFVPPDWMSDADRDRLRIGTLREARSAARIDHPHVVRIYDVVHADGLPWIVMEYVASRSLHQAIVADGPVDPVTAARIGLDVLDALTAAHRAGVLHRDVKPHNVLLGRAGRVVLTDFGLATFVDDGAVTGPGAVVGSPQYVSPERARDGASTVESDLWSFGATLYAAVEGRSPYARDSAMATLMALAVDAPDPAVRAGPLTPVLAGLLRHDPATRLSADDVRELLLAVVETPAPRGGRVARGVVPAPRAAEGARRWGDRPEVARAVARAAIPAAGPVSAAPVSAVPVSAVPVSAVPVSAAPVSAAPVSADPTSAAPTSAAPAPAAPEPVAPASAAPVSSAPVAADPVSAAPVPAAPASAGPGPSEQPAPAPAAPPGTGPDDPAPPVGPAPGPPRTRRRIAVAALTALTVLAGAGVAADRLTRRDPRPAAATPAGPPPAATASAPAGPRAAAFSPAVCAAPPGADQRRTPQSTRTRVRGDWTLPAGWSYYADPSGFQLGVPDFWSYERVGGTLCFRDPAGFNVVSMDAGRDPRGDPVAACRAEAARVRRSGVLPGYRELGVVRAPAGIRAADWTYTFTGRDGVVMQARVRWFAAGGRGYALGWVSRQSEWSSRLPGYDLMVGSFRAAGDAAG